MLCRDDASVRALTKLLDELVIRVYDEGRVQGLEGVPLHGVAGVLDGRRKSRGGGSTDRQEIYFVYNADTA